MPKYTDDQINEAIQKAAAKNTPGPVYAWELSMYKKVIDALPEPQDDWQECTFDEIRKGDRVRLVQAGRTTDFHLPVIETHPTHLVLRDNTQCSNFHKALYYRIPAPVVAPNPAEHPVITIKAINGEPIDAPGNAMFWGGHYRYGYDDMTIAEDITDWEPAKVVPKNFEGNYPKRKLEYKGFPND